MTSTILVNNVSIQKTTIQDFLIQNRKLEAVKYVMEKAGIGISEAKEIVEMFQHKTIDNFDTKDIFSEIMKNTVSAKISTSKISKHKVKPLKKILIFITIFLVSGFLFLKYFIGFQHVGLHWENLQSILFDNRNTTPSKIEQTQIVDTIDIAKEAIESPINILKWEESIKNKDYIPDAMFEEIKRYKKRDFSKLVIAEVAPTDKEAEEAIVHHYKDDVASLLQAEEAHIKIGTCYKAPLQVSSNGNVEVARVTAMVSAYNKSRGNLGNIQQPLGIIYDFVKFQSDPETWYITDFSQNIPYDYKLNKD